MSFSSHTISSYAKSSHAITIFIQTRDFARIRFCPKMRNNLPNLRLPPLTSLEKRRAEVPGLDETRETRLRQFLDNPIDSRHPFEDAKDEKTLMRFDTRLNEPSADVKDEWNIRMQRILHRQQLSMLPHAEEMSLPTREKRFEAALLNPLNQHQVEEVKGTMDLRVRGPMNIWSSNLPKLRYVPSECRKTRPKRKYYI